jgi:hypothetical protein
VLIAGIRVQKADIEYMWEEENEPKIWNAIKNGEIGN